MTMTHNTDILQSARIADRAERWSVTGFCRPDA